MSKGRIFIIMHNDLMHYPPMISLIDILCELGENVTYIGEYTDSPTTKRFASQGVNLVQLGYKREGSQFNRLKAQIRYKRKLTAVLERYHVSNEDLLWYVYSDSATFLHKLLAKYRYLVHYYEFERQEYSWKFKLLYPSFTQEKLVHNAVGIIHCEYNRAQIFKGMMGLERIPFILPNKPYVKDGALGCDIPKAIHETINSLYDRVQGKKVILYQGIFDSKERKLEDFCEAVNLLSDEYVFIAMGRGDKSYEILKEKYESDKILFIPFIIPPYHLLITEKAYIGVLSYSPISKTYYGVINPLYCAPNKIFEYARFGKPMISNDIPGLRNIYDAFNCGAAIKDPVSPLNIVDAINQVSKNYQEKSKGAVKYYNSVDLHSIVKNIIDTTLQK